MAYQDDYEPLRYPDVVKELGIGTPAVKNTGITDALRNGNVTLRIDDSRNLGISDWLEWDVLELALPFGGVVREYEPDSRSVRFEETKIDIMKSLSDICTGTRVMPDILVTSANTAATAFGPAAYMKTALTLTSSCKVICPPGFPDGILYALHQASWAIAPVTQQLVCRHPAMNAVVVTNDFINYQYGSSPFSIAGAGLLQAYQGPLTGYHGQVVSVPIPQPTSQKVNLTGGSGKHGGCECGAWVDQGMHSGWCPLTRKG